MLRGKGLGLCSVDWSGLRIGGRVRWMMMTGRERMASTLLIVGGADGFEDWVEVAVVLLVVEEERGGEAPRVPRVMILRLRGSERTRTRRVGRTTIGVTRGGGKWLGLGSLGRSEVLIALGYKKGHHTVSMLLLAAR